MNKIFKEFEEREALKIQAMEKIQEDKGSSEMENSADVKLNSLKEIGKHLGLGYSTILHKYRQYRATKKVKGGALIQAMNQKRKYKKSRQIETLI